MGKNVKRLLRKHGHECIVFYCSCAELGDVHEEGQTAATLEELVQQLPKPRIVWTMATTSENFAQLVSELMNLLEPGDIVIDSKNSYCQGSISCAAVLQEKGIHYIDVGTTEGNQGVKRGYCLMIGGEPKVVRYLDPIFTALAPVPRSRQIKSNRSRRRKLQSSVAHVHCGSAGAGHFARLVYDGVEQILMKAYAEVLAERESLEEAVLVTSGSPQDY
jgi:6-phosphogluconate dehydrogenase